MPIYEFECKKCALFFDYLVRCAQDVPVCPKCRGKNLRKLISGFAFSSKDKSGNTTASSSCGCGNCAGGDCSGCHG